MIVQMMDHKLADIKSSSDKALWTVQKVTAYVVGLDTNTVLNKQIGLVLATEAVFPQY